MGEWIRHGECNQCGDCCRHATGPITVHLPLADEAFGRVRFGAPIKLLGGLGPAVFRVRGPIEMVCPELKDGNRCGIYATRPETCQTFPTSPEEIEGTRCSYWFERVIHG